jgi:excisionase family DNA binding protein
MNDLLLTNLSIDELKKVISESLSAELQKFNSQESSKEDDQLIKIDEVCRLLNVSKPTIYNWLKKKLIICYRISNKIYFKKEEIINALKKIERRAF